MAQAQNHKSDIPSGDCTPKTMFAPTIDDSIFALIENFLRTYNGDKNPKLTEVSSREHPSFLILLAEKFSKLQDACPFNSKEELICAIEKFLCKEKLIQSESSSNCSETPVAEQFKNFGLCDGSSESILLKIDKYEEYWRPEKLDPLNTSALIDQNLNVLNKLERQRSKEKIPPLYRQNMNKNTKNPKPSHQNKTNNGGRSLHPIKSMSSLLKVSPCSITETIPTGKRIKRKTSWWNLSQRPRKPEKSKISKNQPEPPKSDDVIKTNEPQKPKIINTEYSKCRIKSYSDNSRVVEILKAKDENSFGDVKKKSDLLIIILSDGNTALFTSKCSDNETK